MGLRRSIGRGLNLAGDVAGAVGQAAGAVGQAAGAVGQAGLGLAKAAVTVPEGGTRSPLGKFAAVVQGGAAGFAGRPDLAPESDAQIQAQRVQAAQQALQQLNNQFQTLKNATSIVNQLPEDRRQSAADSLAPQLAKAIPNGVKLFEEMLAAPTIAEGLEKAFEGDPVFEQLLEADPTGATAQEFLISEQGIDYITRLGNISSQGKLLERLPQAAEFLQTNLPEEFKRLKVGGITLQEIQSVNPLLPEELRLSPAEIAAAEDRPDMLLQFGLTLPELDKAILEGKKFDAPTFNENGDLIQTNSKTGEVKILRPKSVGTQTPEARATFRRDFRNGSGEFIKIRNAWKTIQASATGTAAGDIALIFAFMKIIDPTSTVREGEFATVQNAAGVSDRVRALHNSFLKGERFGSDTQRQGFVDQARDIMLGKAKIQIELEETFKTYAAADGVDTRVGGAMIADFLGDDRELVDAPDRLAAAQPGQRAAPTEDDVERIARQIGSRDPLAIRQAAEEEGFSF